MKQVAIQRYTRRKQASTKFVKHSALFLLIVSRAEISAMSTQTRLIGHIKFDNDMLRRDLQFLSELPVIEEQYDEFSHGTWINHSLWNRTGEWTDTTYSDYDFPAIRTQAGTKAAYLSKIIEDYFDTKHMRMARVRNLIKGLVVPHTDFLELSKERGCYIRILIPLETCLNSYHAEENFGVFRMRKGDIWVLKSTVPHSALNLSSDNRRILSLDFQYDDTDNPHYSLIFKDTSIFNDGIAPALVARTHLEDEDLEDYLRLLSERFHEKEDAGKILISLSEIQLRFESSVSDIYHHLNAVAKLTKRQDLIDHCERMQKFYIGRRVMNERFPLRGV